MGLLFATTDMKKKKKVQEPQQNGMLSCCIAIGFISKNEEYNPK